MKQSKDFFWPSYVDLMTALFLTMLVLFVLSYKQFQGEKKKLKDANELLNARVEQLDAIERIEKSLKQLEDPRYFTYKPKYKRYELNFEVEFRSGIYALPPEARQPLIETGRFLLRQMNNLGQNSGIQYLIIVEGRAAMNYNYPETHPVNADTQAIRELSYNRALAVLNLWREAGIRFPLNIELLPAGSGYSGAGRYTGRDEKLNKRFIIQIQPKIGSIEKN